MKLYSDLIIEANFPLTFTSITHSRYGIDIAEHDVDKELSSKIGRKQGKYVSLFLDDDVQDEHIVEVLKNYISKMAHCSNTNTNKIFVVGLGNENYIVDRLGELCTKKIKTQKNKLMTICPDVKINTGIDSTEIIKSVCSNICPTLCIVIDSIATLSTKRLANCFQLTSAGIRPGGGVNKKDNIFIDESYLHCPVISIGFPLILSTNYGYLSPYNIEDVIKKASDVISKAINAFF